MLKKTLAVLLAITALQGCANRLGDLSIASTKNINLKSQVHQVDTSRRVSGEDRIHIIFFVPTSTYPNLEEAIDNAMKAAPGSVALSDVTIKRGFWYLPLIYGQEYVEVEGNPVFEVETKPSAPSANALPERQGGGAEAMGKTQWQSLQLQQLQGEKGLSYEEYQRRYKIIMGR